MSAIGYHRLKAARALFGAPPQSLSGPEAAKAEDAAHKALALEDAILASPEAAGVVIADRGVDLALEDILERYDDPAAFAADLADAGLDEQGFRTALRRQMAAEAALGSIGARAPAATAADARAWFDAHPEKFQRPERRAVRHILITVNTDYPDNTPNKARERIEALRARLNAGRDAFADLAAQYSECPTALKGGEIGLVPRGQLLDALDSALFDMAAPGLTPVIATEMGLHIGLLERIEPAAAARFDEAEAALTKALTGAKRQAVQRAWLKTLQGRMGEQTCAA